MKFPILAMLTATTTLCSAASAQTNFHIKQIIIAGDVNVNATAINNKGSIVGTLYAGITDDPSGIEIDGTTVTTLPLPQASYGALNPMAINQNGDILGWARGSFLGIAQTFLLQGGAYNPAYQQVVIEPGQYAADFLPDPMGLTNTDKIFFNTVFGLSDPVGTSYGKPPNFHHAPDEGRFTVLQSIDEAGTVVGTSFSFSGIHTMFAGSGKTFVTITPPGSTNTLGGYQNNKGAIAGSYVDASRTYHGFVYQAGNYTSFDMPEAAANIAVTGINNAGRVVGRYAAASNGKIHAFLYNGNTVSSFGLYNSTDNVAVALNDRGIMVVARQIAGEKPSYESYRVICSGTGC